MSRAVPSPDGKQIAWLFWQSPDYSKLPLGAFPTPPTMCPTALVMVDTATGRPRFRREFKECDLNSLPFTADSRVFLTVGDKVRAWDAATGKELFALDGPAWRLALSPDGRRAIVADGWSRVRLWDLEARRPMRELLSGRVYVNSDTLKSQQAFSADGKTLLLASDSTLRVFDTATGRERAGPPHHGPVVAGFSDDGRTLITACAEIECKWNLTGKKPVLEARAPLHIHEGIGRDRPLAHSPDGRLFIDQPDHHTRVRDSATGRVIRELTDAPAAFFGLFSPNGNRVLLQGSPPGQLGPYIANLYDVRTGRKTGQIADDRQGYPVFSPDGRLVAWADDTHAVHLYDAESGKAIRTLAAKPPIPERCNEAQVFFTPDGSNLIAATYYRDVLAGPGDPAKWHKFPVRVVRVADGRPVAQFYANPATTRNAEELSCAACSPDGRLLAVAEKESGVIRLFEIISGGLRVELIGHLHGVHGMAFSPDCRTLASGGDDNVTYLWDVTGARTGPAPAAASGQNLERWWADLAAEDARRAGVAATAFLRAASSGIAFIQDHLRPVDGPGAALLAELIAGLDADSFTAREVSSRELALLGDRAEAALIRAKKERPSAEAARRIDGLLDRLDGSLGSDELRVLRAIEILEHLGTPDAKRCLEVVGRGVPDARPTRDARSALARLAAQR